MASPAIPIDLGGTLAPLAVDDRASFVKNASARILGDYLTAFLTRYAGDAWQAATGLPIVKNTFAHDPEQYVFSVGHLPALYVFPTGTTKSPEQTTEDWRIHTIRYRVFWVLPPGEQLKISRWAEVFEFIGTLIDTAIVAGRDPCYVIDDDPDDSAQYEGSVVQRHAGFIYMEGGQWSAGRIAIKPPGGAKVDGWNGAGLYDGLQSEVIAQKTPNQLIGTDPDHPEWGPTAGNAVTAPAQLAISINGGAVEGVFLVGYTMLFIEDGSVAQAIGTTPAKLTGFTGEGQAAGVLPDSANDKITIANAGTYNVVAAFSVSGTASHKAILRCRNNGIAVAGLRGDVTLSSDVKTIALCGQVGCAQGDVLELWVESDFDGTSMTPLSGTLAVTRI